VTRTSASGAVLPIAASSASADFDAGRGAFATARVTARSSATVASSSGTRRAFFPRPTSIFRRSKRIGSGGLASSPVFASMYASAASSLATPYRFSSSGLAYRATRTLRKPVARSTFILSTKNSPASLYPPNR
jgi:hypothetical protein